MSWIWIGIAVLVAVLGVWHRGRTAAARGSGEHRVDDAAVRRILDEGTLGDGGDGEPLDMAEAARAEEDFFAESWDEPEELRP